MSGVQLNRVTNANLYINGNSLLGTAEELQLPDLDVLESEHKALGLVGTNMLPTGFDKLTGKIKWNSYYAAIWLAVANPFMPVSLQARSSVSTYASNGLVSELPLVTFVTMTIKKLPLGTFKPKDNTDFQSEFTCTYVKQQFNGQDVIELDTMANIFKVGGVDQLANYRLNIGG
jgi:uncharacterized protein